MVIDLVDNKFDSTQVHRFSNKPLRGSDGSLRWDWPRLVREVKRGLDAAIDQKEITSIGIDAWGVDYGLVTEEGKLVSLPFSYRDDRTNKWREISKAGLRRSKVAIALVTPSE